MKRVWHFVVPVLMVILLMVMTVGVVCHHHDCTNSANCTLCHLAIEAALSGPVQCGFLAQHHSDAGKSQAFVPRLIASELPPRAPPA